MGVDVVDGDVGDVVFEGEEEAVFVGVVVALGEDVGALGLLALVAEAVAVLERRVVEDLGVFVSGAHLLGNGQAARRWLAGGQRGLQNRLLHPRRHVALQRLGVLNARCQAVLHVQHVAAQCVQARERLLRHPRRRVLQTQVELQQVLLLLELTLPTRLLLEVLGLNLHRCLLLRRPPHCLHLLDRLCQLSHFQSQNLVNHLSFHKLHSILLHSGLFSLSILVHFFL